MFLSDSPRIEQDMLSVYINPLQLEGWEDPGRAQLPQSTTFLPPLSDNPKYSVITAIWSAAENFPA